MSRGEKETETEAMRLIEHIEQALAAVAARSTVDVESLEAVADRIERAARDLSARYENWLSNAASPKRRLSNLGRQAPESERITKPAPLKPDSQKRP